MKLLLCADVRLGAVCAENLGSKLSHRWQEARREKLATLIDKAVQNNVAYVAFYGQLFGQERVPELVIDCLFAAANEDKNIRMLAFLMTDEYNRVAYRNDIPENLHLICLQTGDTYTDDNIALRINKGATELQLGDNEPIWIKRSGEGVFALSGIGKDRVIPSFEPIGFEDAREIKCGYGIVDWSDEEIKGYAEVENQKYVFRSVELKIRPEDSRKDIVRKINAATSKMSTDSFLRITIAGRSTFGIMLDSDALKNLLQNKVFFAEIYDNTIMDINEEEFENDISLRSEFVRLALQDDSLSESERSRIISCGWNALNGKEVSAE